MHAIISKKFNSECTHAKVQLGFERPVCITYVHIHIHYSSRVYSIENKLILLRMVSFSNDPTAKVASNAFQTNNSGIETPSECKYNLKHSQMCVRLPKRLALANKIMSRYKMCNK